MGSLYAPANELLYLATGTAGGLGVYRKAAKDVGQGEFVWCFVISSYAPEIRGHFEFLQVTGDAQLSTVNAQQCRWFNHSDGPTVVVPDDWALFEGPNLVFARERQNFRGFAHPGFLHDVLPLALDLELFSSGFLSPKLTEAAAYFLGAFAIRPQMQPNGLDTWGAFGTSINPAGVFGTSNITRHPQLRQWLLAHKSSVETLAAAAWGPGNFVSEQRASRIGLADISVTAPLAGSRQLANSGVTGFSVHAPIGRGISLTSAGRPTDDDLRLVQYWYSCIRSNLLERTSNSVKKAFLLGALDTVSNADSSRKSIGLDFGEDFVGEFPLYSALHEVGQAVLDTFEGDETGNPRVTANRTRGRIPRCRIFDAATTRDAGVAKQQVIARTTMQEVIAQTAVHTVVLRAAIQRVSARTTKEQVCTGPTGDAVIAGVAIEFVCASIARDLIVAIAAADTVIASITVQMVIARIAIEPIVAVVAVHGVIADTTIKQVIAIIAGDFVVVLTAIDRV